VFSRNVSSGALTFGEMQQDGVSGDSKIGIPEVIYGLQKIAWLRLNII
jgi:hypothetical protein